MTRPTTRLDIDWSDPTGPFLGTDETGYFRKANINLGRSSELDQQQAGVATITLDNTTGRFDPVNASGALYPNVLPMRRARLSTEVPSATTAFTARRSSVHGTDVIRGGGTETFYLITGFIESIHQRWAQGNGDAETVLRIVDGFGVLNLADFIWGHRYTGADSFICGEGVGNIVPTNGPPFIPDDLTGTRVNRVLDCIGWPTEERDIDDGTVTIWGSDISVGGTTNIKVSEKALAHLLKLVETEGGWLFMDPLGRVKFIDAAHDSTLDPFDVFGGQGDELPFINVEAPFDTSRLWNEITIEAGSLVGAPTATDATSIIRYFPRPQSFTYLATAFATLDARADQLLARYKDPKLRLLPLQLTATSDTGWRRILSKELLDKVRIRKRPATADMIEVDCRIEGITIDIPGGTEWNVTWELSALSPAGVIGVLIDDPAVAIDDAVAVIDG